MLFTRISRFTGAFFLLFVSLSAQTTRTDSLESLLQSTSGDSSRIRLLMQISLEYRKTDPSKAVQNALQAKELSSRSGNERLLYEAGASLGATYILVGDYTKARENLEQALALAQKYNDTRITGNCFHNLGNTEYALGFHDRAISYYEKAIEIRTALKDEAGVAASTGNIGLAYFSKDNKKKALDYYYAALPIKEKLGDYNGAGNTLNNMGNIFSDLREPKKAFDAYAKAIELYEKGGSKIGIASGHHNLGTACFDLGRYDEALDHYRVALALRRELGVGLPITETLINIANSYQQKKETGPMRLYYGWALALGDSIGDKEIRIICRSNIAPMLARAGQKDSAFALLKQAEVIQQSTGSVQQKIYLLKGYTEVYSVLRDFEKAYETFQQYIGLRDSLNSTDIARQQTELDARYESDKKAQAIELLTKDKQLLEKDKERNKIVMLGVSLVLLIALCFSVLLLRSNNLKKRINKLLQVKNTEISAINKDITDSINYARRIQAAVLPDEKILSAAVKDAFILNRPRDIVSGDFYWFARKNNFLYIAAADCTGHGVPGALVSVVGINALQQLIEQEGTPDTSALLGKLHRQVILAMNKDVNLRETQDGMDIALVRIDLASRAAQFSGAGRPLFYMTEGQEKIQQIGGDRSSIAGVKLFDDTTPYTLHELKLEKQTTFYLFSDGIVDQFGGPDKSGGGKKFLTRRLVELLGNVRNLPLTAQRKKIEEEMDAWRGDQQQTDDMLMIGFTV